MPGSKFKLLPGIIVLNRKKAICQFWSNRAFPIALLKEALSDFTKAKTIFGLVESDITDNKVDVFVRANSKDGRTVRFDISSSFDMKIRELLNDRGEAVLSDSAFIKKCNEKCEVIEHRLGRA